jgi:hypothetical protein
MNTTTEAEIQNRSTEAVAFIDAWLNEHAWWADARSIDFALDVRRVLSDAEQEQIEEGDLTSVGAAD